MFILLWWEHKHYKYVEFMFLFFNVVDVAAISKILRHANIEATLKTHTHLFMENYNAGLQKIKQFKHSYQ